MSEVRKRNVDTDSENRAVCDENMQGLAYTDMPVDKQEAMPSSVGEDSNATNINGGKSKVKVSAKLKAFARKLAGMVKDAVYPNDITCDCCGGELVADTRYRLCAKCIERMPFVDGHRCLACGVPLDDESDYCNRCQNDRGVYVKNRSPLVYDGEARRLIYALKFGKKQYIAQTLGALMADEYLKSDMQADILVFVPMSAKEEKKRGFNQSALLAYEIGARLNIPVLPALVKVRDTSQQKELKGKNRARNLEGAFACVFEQVKNRKIVLIDDIFTTGATANECAKALLKAKAREVSVLTCAVTKLKTVFENDGNGAKITEKADAKRRVERQCAENIKKN